MPTSATFFLVHAIARDRAALAIRQAPDGYKVHISKPKRNDAINAALHAKLSEIAAGREWAGRRWDLEVWKRLLVAAWSRAKGEHLQILPALDGQGVDIVQRHTSAMSQHEVSELLAYIEAWEAETAPS